MKYSVERRSAFDIPLSEPTTLYTILAQLNIPREEAQIIIINHKLAETKDVMLNDEDDVIVYPVLSGG